MNTSTGNTVTAARRIERVIVAPRMLEGEGFEVRRPVPSTNLPGVGPFIMLDHFGPINYGPGEAKGAPNHPHRGIETFTYMLSGGGQHRDSLGNVSVIEAGEGQWMRAGSGIMHDEGADDTLKTQGGVMEGLQFWINLPRDRKMSAPVYRAIERDMIPELTIGAARLKLMAGSHGGVRGPIETWANPWLGLAELAVGQDLEFSPDAVELGVYVISGEIVIDGRTLEEGDLAVLTPGTLLSIKVQTDARFFVLGGDPLDAPLRRYGPFVMNTDQEIMQAVRDFQAGKFGTIPAPVPA